MGSYRACGTSMGAAAGKVAAMLARKGARAVIHVAREGRPLIGLCGTAPRAGHLVFSSDRSIADCPRCLERTADAAR